MGRRVRRGVLVALLVLAAVVAPVALPIRIVVLHLRRETKKTEFVVLQERADSIRLPQTV